MLKYAKEFDADIVAGLAVNNVVLRENGPNLLQWRGEEGLVQSLRDNPFTYAVLGKIYRNSFVGETRFDENYRINEDSFFVFEMLCKQPKFITLDEGIYCYRDNVDSASHTSFSEKYFDIIDISKKKYEIIEKQYPEFIDLAENMRLKAIMNILQILALRAAGEYREKEKELLKDFYRKSKYYVSAKKTDDKWFCILKFRLYWIYKGIMRIRRKTT